MKLLFISNITGKKVGSFSIASIMAAKELGFEYHMAANFKNSTSEQMMRDEEEYGITLHQIDFERNPLNPVNRKAYRQVVELIENEKFDVIHCNTPVGGMIGRLAGKECNVSKIIYQAHGFHFYKGAPMANWLIYYPIERWLAHYTDALITINKEDYERAQKFHLRNHGKTYYVPGVGVDTSQYEPRNFQRDKKREELGLKIDDVMIISAGDLIERKNYKTSIEAIAKAGNTTLQYFICGQGPLEEELKILAAELGVEEQVHFLGFRTDMKELLWASDIFLFTTLQEGLPRSLSEAMASGLPCVVSRIRGNIDLITDQEWLHEPNDSDGFAESLKKLANDESIRKSVGLNCLQRICNFDFKSAEEEIVKVYKTELGETVGKLNSNSQNPQDIVSNEKIEYTMMWEKNQKTEFSDGLGGY